MEPPFAGLADRLRALRRQRNMTQAQLAVLVGIRTGPLNALERGHHLPSARVLYRLAGALGVTVDALFGPPGQDAPGVGAAQGPAPCARPAGAVGIARAGLVRMAGSETPITAEAGAMMDALAGAFLTLEDLCGVQKSAAIPLRLNMGGGEAGMAALVQRVRGLLGIGGAVIFDYMELLESAGLRVIVAPLPAGLESGACYDAAAGNAFLFVADGMNVERQVFRLLCELGRVYLFTGSVRLAGRRGAAGRDVDRAARKFAALFLMPADAVCGTVSQAGIRPGDWDYELLLRLKHRFGVSAQAFLYRLGELRLIRRARVKELDRRIEQHYARTAFAEPAASRRTLAPNGRFGDLLLVAARRGERGELAGVREVIARYGIRTDGGEGRGQA